MLNTKSISQNMESIDCKKLFEFFGLIETLKHHKRRGWVIKDLNDCETVTDHMYRMAMMTFLLPDNNIDKIKCMQIALVHDLGECITGDITIHDNISKEEKRILDDNAMKCIVNLTGSTGEEFYKLFKEYEEGSTAEGKFVKELDKFEAILQAFEYEKRLNSPLKFQEFFDNTKEILDKSHPFIKKMVDHLNEERHHFNQQQESQ